MTSEALERIKDLENQKKEFESCKLGIDKHIQAIRESCDHIWPDGKSAWVGGFFCSSCDICGYSDL
jgi:hypothetical protein